MKSRRTARLCGGLATALIAAAALVSGARTAAAQNAGLDLPSPGIPPPPLSGGIESSDKRDFWRAGKRRWFFSATGEVGAIYGRASGAFGYGRPHWFWFGAETSAALGTGGGATYAGLRFASPRVDVRVGARYLFATSQRFLVPRESYTKDDTEERVGAYQRYVSLEQEVAGSVPIPHGAIFGITGLYYLVGTPEGWNLFDQNLQVVAAPGVLWRGRLGCLFNVDKWDTFRIGGSVEVIGNPSRDLIVVRAGPTVTTLITHHLEAYGTALLVVHSKDLLGLAGAQTGELGLRYRWATGDRWPEFP